MDEDTDMGLEEAARPKLDDSTGHAATAAGQSEPPSAIALTNGAGTVVICLLRRIFCDAIEFEGWLFVKLFFIFKKLKASKCFFATED
ncbi:hypothetical protein [Tardiphaga sp.]|uniref:hypothetical protein n=1 Tax=Tardiphaga sp. TaxID=1926292 RepID=UPI00261370FE|nr:hypothetical protein [Tardiphaga sp.]